MSMSIQEINQHLKIMNVYYFILPPLLRLQFHGSLKIFVKAINRRVTPLNKYILYVTYRHP